MVFSDDDDPIAQWWEEEDDFLIAQWWDEEDDSDDDDCYIIAAVILDMEHERTKMKRRGSVLGHQVVRRDMPSCNLPIVTNRRPRTDNSTPSLEKVSQEEDEDSSKIQTPDSSRPSQKKRPIGRKAKEKMRTGGETGLYKEALQELLAVKKKEMKLKEERWKEIKSLHERKLALEERMLMWEQEQRIMFCDVSTMEPEQKANVFAMRAQIASQKMAFFNESFGEASSAFCGGSGGIRGSSS